MGSVTVRDLRNHGGEVLDRVEAGERVTVTRNGRPVAELVPLAKRALSGEELTARAAALPPVDPAKLASDVDAVLDTGLFPER
jgi:prevent-host-death family protein